MSRTTNMRKTIIISCCVYGLLLGCKAHNNITDTSVSSRNLESTEVVMKRFSLVDSLEWEEVFLIHVLKTGKSIGKLIDLKLPWTIPVKE